MRWIVWWGREDVFTMEKDPENPQFSNIHCETLEGVYEAVEEIARLLPLEPSFPKSARPEAANLLERVKAVSPQFGLDKDYGEDFEFPVGNFMLGVEERPW